MAILPELDFTETRFIANVSGSTIEEYVAVTRAFDQSPIDAIEINISCPNVKEGGVAFGIKLAVLRPGKCSVGDELQVTGWDESQLVITGGSSSTAP